MVRHEPARGRRSSSTTSTAAAAAALADGTAPWDAAICAPFAAERLRPRRARRGRRRQPVGRDPLRAGVRARRHRRPATGSDKTSLVLYIGKDHPGALLEILTEFAVRGINLTRIESRPTGGGIGDYFFRVDAEGHIDDARVGEALMGLHRVCADVRYLGSLPPRGRRTSHAAARRLRRGVPRGPGLALPGPRRAAPDGWAPARSRQALRTLNRPRPHAQDRTRSRRCPKVDVCNAAKGDMCVAGARPDLTRSPLVSLLAMVALGVCPGRRRAARCSASRR